MVSPVCPPPASKVHSESCCICVRVLPQAATRGRMLLACMTVVFDLSGFIENVCACVQEWIS